MKGSDDSQVNNNYKTLIETQRRIKGEFKVDYNMLGFVNGKIIENPKKSILPTLESNNTGNNEIDIVAHGNGRGEILIVKSKSEYQGISPEQLADFINENTFKDNQYNFSKLKLYACECKIFGEKLSRLLPGIEITCFDEEIYLSMKVDSLSPNEPLVYSNMDNTSPARSYKYLNGNLNIDDEKALSVEDTLSVDVSSISFEEKKDTGVASNEAHLQQDNQSSAGLPRQDSNDLEKLINDNLNSLSSMRSSHNHVAPPRGKIIRNPESSIYQLALKSNNSHSSENDKANSLDEDSTENKNLKRM